MWRIWIRWRLWNLTSNNCIKTDTTSKSYACVKSTINNLIQCKRINIDSVCKLDASNYCAIDSVNDNEGCLWSDDRKTCKRVPKDAIYIPIQIVEV